VAGDGHRVKCGFGTCKPFGRRRSCLFANVKVENAKHHEAHHHVHLWLLWLERAFATMIRACRSSRCRG
jgi:hypothetical protein